MDQKIVNSAKSAIDDLLKLSLAGAPRLWTDYDREADVLYISFGDPQKADDSIHGEDDIIRRKRKGKIVGLTVLNASRYSL